MHKNHIPFRNTPKLFKDHLQVDDTSMLDQKPAELRKFAVEIHKKGVSEGPMGEEAHHVVAEPGVNPTLLRVHTGFRKRKMTRCSLDEGGLIAEAMNRNGQPEGTPKFSLFTHVLWVDDGDLDDGSWYSLACVSKRAQNCRRANTGSGIEQMIKS
ncbi:hypothetical protein ACLMJK_007918 [Lecanora helva]